MQDEVWPAHPFFEGDGAVGSNAFGMARGCHPPVGQGYYALDEGIEQVNARAYTDGRPVIFSALGGGHSGVESRIKRSRHHFVSRLGKSWMV